MHCSKFTFDVSSCLALPILSTPKICGIPHESLLLFLTSSPKGLENFFYQGNLHLLQTADPAKIKV